MGIFWSDIFTLVWCCTTVSYTHLDVYKRQIEEKILELQEGKKNLVTTVLDGNESRASMTVEDIKEILGIAIS